MATTKISALIMIFLLAFCIYASDMCMKSEASCTEDVDCQAGCPGKQGQCIDGRCWCIGAKSLYDITPRLIPSNAK
ncbi:unnamed protein product [Lathyrus oleraceus]